jgi:chemotaxis methyl-accepting protein methylase
LISVDQQDGLQLDITIDRGNQLLASLVSKQSRLMRNALKVLLLTVGASTFTDFVHKMKKDPEDVEVTITTLTKIMTIFFADLGKKYLTKETEATIKGKISGLFA